MLVVILSVFHGTTETKGFEPMLPGCSIGGISDGTCAVHQLVIMPLSLVCEQNGNMQASWAASHLTFSPTRAWY